MKGWLVKGSARILIVDDETDLCSYLCEVLRRQGYETEHAGDGLGAMEKLASKAFDVVLADIRMPGMNGIELLRQIKGRYPDVIVVVMTAYSYLNYAIDTVRYGAHDLLIKPFEGPSVVIEAVQRGLERRVQDGEREVALK